MTTANSAVIAANVPEPGLSEPISPELVLVDPELRRAALARLVHEDALAALAEARPATPKPLSPPPAREPQAQPVAPAPPPPPETVRAPRRTATWSRALRKPVIVPALVALSVFVALGVSEARISEPGLEPAPLPAAGTKSPSPARPAQTNRKRPSAGARPGTRKARPSRLPSDRAASAAVERKVLAQIIQAPRGKLPPTLIDSKTGLAKNGLQANCNPADPPGSFLCIVQPARHRPKQGIRVRYTSGGSFTWYRYADG
jgi:hypothetical protein